MWLRICWAQAALLALAVAVPVEDFYPFGLSLDNVLKSGDSVSSSEVILSVPIQFFSELHSSIYVNVNGLLSFLTEVPSFYNVQFPLEYPLIAPLYSNVDTSGSGSVFYRETSDPKLLEQATNKIRRLYPNLEKHFEARSLFIATWYKVGYFDHGTDKVNTFQVAVITDGDESFVELLYADGGIEWVQGKNRGLPLPDARAQAGIVAQDGRLYTLRGSGTDQIKNLDRWSNTNIPGNYMFRVGHIPETGNVEPPQITIDEYLEIEENSQTCATCSIYCHSRADCFDTEIGYCCKCQNGFYGNGRNCFLDGLPLRVIGKINISVNDVEAHNLDLQAYVVTTDGRSYTAVSGMPQSVGNEMQLVESLGSIIAWMFAKPINEAKNGFQLTGGVLNHSVDIVFDTNHKVSLKQKYLGLDVYDQLKMEAEISGTLPFIPSGTTLKVPDFQEQFTKYQPGHFRSQTKHIVEIEKSEETHHFFKDQWIEFTEYCTDSTEGITTLRLKSARNYVQFDSEQGILRFSSTNKISKNAEGGDPCIEGHVKCVANSSCLVEGDSFKCVCNPGFEALYPEGTGNDFGCVDINECEDGSAGCHLNAICVNEVGSHSCQCRPGFNGDGRTCEEDLSPCEQNPLLCSPNILCPIEGDYTSCECKAGYQMVQQSDARLGFICEDIDECSQGLCDPSATCYNNDGGFECYCRHGFFGNGFTCEELISRENEDSCYGVSCPEGSECQTNLADGAQCVCKSNYYGTPPYCTESPIIGCSRDSECHILAKCIKSESTGGYSCECQSGYIGDGYSCYPSSTDETIVRTCKQNVCWCPPDFQDNGELCVKIREPIVKLQKGSCNTQNVCHPDAQCIFVASKQEFQCKCNAGYEGDGYECTTIEASCDEAEICDLHATCKYHETSSRHICICNIGFQGDGTTCYPSGECSTLEECENNEECVYNEEKASSECVCIDGYIKEDQTCVPNKRCSSPCHFNAECIYDEEIEQGRCKCNNGFIGDGVFDCKTSIAGCNILENCSPHADCIFDVEEEGYNCHCREGFEGDGLVCNSIRNCQNTPNMCSPEATCIRFHDEYQCRCNEGFIGNGSVCKEAKRQEQGFLLINQGRSTLRIPFHPSRFNRGQPIHLHQGQTAIGIAIDCLEGRVYWSDISHQTIKSSNYDGTDIQDFLTTGIDSPEGLAIDWIHRKIYWTDSGLDTINVQSLEDNDHKAIITEGLVNPRGIAVHPWRRRIFWSDWNREDPKLEVANLDGSGRAVLLKGPHVRLPNSLAIDWITDELCWADAGTETIECLRMSSNTRRTVVQKSRYPFGLAITPEKYYWTDWITHKIETATKETGEILKPIDLPLGGDDKLYGIVAVTATCPR